MLQISWKDLRTSESVLNKTSSDRKFVATIKKWKWQYFRAQNLFIHIFEGGLDGPRSRGKPRR